MYINTLALKINSLFLRFRYDLILRDEIGVRR